VDWVPEKMKNELDRVVDTRLKKVCLFAYANDDFSPLPISAPSLFHPLAISLARTLSLFHSPVARACAF
jgi:hypothetical protein